MGLASKDESSMDRKERANEMIKEALSLLKGEVDDPEEYVRAQMGEDSEEESEEEAPKQGGQKLALIIAKMKQKVGKKEE